MHDTPPAPDERPAPDAPTASPPPPPTPTPSASASEPPGDPLLALIHECFVTYNPLYLASATLVLGGLWLVWRDLGSRVAMGGLGVAAVAELYALSLIASAAVLRSIGQRRIAVMLGLLAALYQCDVTLALETCSFLGAIGWLGTLAWIALFVIKLRGLAWALGLTLSRSATWVPILGAAAVALLPQWFRIVPVSSRGMLVALVVFAVATAALWTSRDVRCADGFDYRGRRSVRGVWILWGAMALAHVAYWAADLGVSLVGLVPALPLLWTRRMPRTGAVVTTVLATLGTVGLLAPSLLALTAFMSAVVLALRALRAPSIAPLHAREPVEPPYRGTAPMPIDAVITTLAAPPTRFDLAAPVLRMRLLLGSLACAYLSASTLGASDLWSAHTPALDVALALACLIALWRARRLEALAPLVPMTAHLAVQLGWLATPRGATEWGAWSIVLGFATLAAAVGTSWITHQRRDRAHVAATRVWTPPAAPAPPPTLRT